MKSNARRLKLSIQHHQIFLTTPPKISEQVVQAFLRQSESWLVDTWQKVYKQTSLAKIPIHGEKLNLPLLNQCFEIVLDHKNGSPDANQLIDSNFLVSHLNSQLIVSAQESGKLLKQWVREQAAIALPRRLKELAEQHGFEYLTCQVRHAKTRWGSCSATASINLNAALILMPVALVDYVILHELCHTRQLNHSAQFWHEVHQVDANYMQHRQQLKQFKLPSWWHLS